MITTFLIAVASGLVIGVLSGLLGIGGGTIMVPLFRLALGLSAVGATATSLFTIIPTSISGAVQHIRNKTCVPKLGVMLGIGGACLSPVGVWFAQVSPGWLVMVAAALAIGYSAFTMLKKAIKAPASASAPTGQAAPADSDAFAGQAAPASQAAPARTGQAAPADPAVSAEPSSAFDLNAATLAKAAAIGAFAGLASGYIGLGGGFLMIPLMVSLLNMPMRLASGTSLIGVMILALPATILQCALGNVDYLVGVAVACGSIPGALIGASLVARVPERALRFTFAAFLGVAAILLVVNELGVI